MKKTLSLLLAAMLVVTIVAIPAMATTTKAQFINRYMGYMDLGSYEAGTVLTNANVANTGVISAAGAGTSIRDVTIDGTTINDVPFVNLVDISTQATEESISKVTVVEVEGEKMLKLEAGKNYDNAGIALSPISGKLFKETPKFTPQFAFDFYQPAYGYQVNSLNIGFAKIESDGTLSYYEVNELNLENPSAVNASSVTVMNPSKPNGVSPVFYYEQNIPKIRTINRHNINTGVYLGGGGFGNGAPGFLDLDLSDGTTVDFADINKIYDHWYSNSFKLQYFEGVGIRIFSQSSYDVDNEEWPTYCCATIPLTSIELNCLESVQIVPVIAINADTQGSRYMYIKDVRASVEGVYNKSTSSDTKVLMSDSFESAAIGSVNNTAYNSSYIQGYGIYNNRHLAAASSTAKMSVSVAANPSYKGNNSAKVLDIHGTSRDGSKWAGFRSQPIPTGVFTSNADGATFMYDKYLPASNECDFMNGRLYLHALDANGAVKCTGADSDKSEEYKIMAHLGNKFSVVQYNFNNANNSGTNTLMFEESGKENWIRIAFNVRAAADGTAIVKMRKCNLATGEWTDWTQDMSFPLNLFSNEYLVWCESYNYSRNSSSADGVNHIYLDNFALVTGSVSPVAEIKGSDANIVMPEDTFTATFDAPVADPELLKKITVSDSMGEQVAADISVEIVDGKTVVTIDPVDDLVSEETYTIDFAGNKTILGEEIPDVQFVAQDDWAAPEEAPVVVFSGDKKLVADEVLTVSMEVDGYALETSGYKVYSDSDAVTITENESDGVYEITAAKDGVATLYVQSLLYPGAGNETYTVEALVPEKAYTATYYIGDEVVYTEKVAENAIADGYEINDEDFAGWATTEGGSVESLAPVTADINYYAVISKIIDIEFVSNDETMGEIVDPVISIASGSTLPAAPDYILTDAKYALKGWELNGEVLTTEELLAAIISEEVTITAIFKQAKIDFGDEYDFTTMTAEDFASSPLSEEANLTLTEGAGIELVKSENTRYYFDFVEDEVAEGTYIIEFDYIPADTDTTFSGFDASLLGKEGAPRKLHGQYISKTGYNDLMYSPTGGSEMAPAYRNLTLVKGEKHTVKYVVDFTTSKALTIVDGVAGIDGGSYDIAYADAGAPRSWTPYVKPGGSLLLTRFKFEKLNGANVVKVNVEFDENTNNAGFLNNSSAICTQEMYMLEGTKVDLGVNISAEGYEIDEINATAGAVVENGENYIYTAGAEDATISVASKQATVMATFDIGEGTLVSGDAEQTIAKGQAPVAPAVNAPEGKVFIGWSPAVGAITADTVYTAIYTDAETVVEVTFVSENDDVAILNETVKAIKGGNIGVIPEYETINGATFLYWEDEAGVHYTDEELGAKVFDADETITGVFKQAYINNGIFDFTQHDVATFGGSITGAGGYTVNEDGSIHIEGSSGTTNNTKIEGSLNGADSGTWVLTIDYKVNDGKSGSINGLSKSSSGNTQSLFLIGDNIFVRTGDGSGAPGTAFTTFEQLGLLTNGERHTVKAYYNLDDLSFRLSVDGHFAKLPTYKLPAASLTSISYNFFNGFEGDVYAIGFEKLAEEDYPEYIASTEAYEYSSVCKTYIYEGPVSEGDKVLYRAFDTEGYLFKGWYLDDGAEPVSTELTYTHTVTGDYKLVPKYVVKPKYRTGDVNLNGKVDVYDAIAVLKSIAGITVLEDDAAAAADVDGDGTVSVTDATTILKYIARIIANF